MIEKLIINADDFGLSDNISHEILNLLNENIINSTSVIINGTCNERYLNDLKYIDKSIKLHLNLIEFKPLTNSHQNYLITNKDGNLENSFFSFFSKSFLLSKNKIQKLKNQIKSEILLQIEKYQDYTKKEFIDIDSHQHVHNVPFIYNIINSLREEKKIKSIRRCNEIIFKSDFFKLDFSKINNKSVIKKFIFHILNLKNKKINSLTDFTFGSNENFNINNKKIYSNLKYLNQKKEIKSLEIFCHPGKANIDEFNDLSSNENLIKFYTSPDRDKEKIFLRSQNFEEFKLKASTL